MAAMDMAAVLGVDSKNWGINPTPAIKIPMGNNTRET